MTALTTMSRSKNLRAVFGRIALAHQWSSLTKKTTPSCTSPLTASGTARGNHEDYAQQRSDEGYPFHPGVVPATARLPVAKDAIASWERVRWSQGSLAYGRGVRG